MTDRQKCVLYSTHTLQNTWVSITCSFLSRILYNIDTTLELSLTRITVLSRSFFVRVIFALRKNRELQKSFDTFTATLKHNS